MWKYFLKSLFNLLKQIIIIFILSIAIMLSITIIVHLGAVAIIIIAIALFLYCVYEDAKRNYKRDRDIKRVQMSNGISNTLNLLYNPMLFARRDEYESLKKQFEKQMNEYKKEFGEDVHYTTLSEQYGEYLKREAELEQVF